MVVKMTDSAADAEQTALSGASRRPPNAQACPAWRRKRAKPPSPCPQTVGRSPPSVLRAQKATDGKRKGKWQQASCTSLPTTTSTRTWLAVGTTKNRGQRGGGKLRQYGQGGYIHRPRQPKATRAKNKTTHGTRVQNEPTILRRALAQSAVWWWRMERAGKCWDVRGRVRGRGEVWGSAGSAR